MTLSSISGIQNIFSCPHPLQISHSNPTPTPTTKHIESQNNSDPFLSVLNGVKSSQFSKMCKYYLGWIIYSYHITVSLLYIKQE